MNMQKGVVTLLIAAALTVGCGTGGRSAAIEACFEARYLFASVPNPAAGQEIPNPEGQGRPQRLPPRGGSVRREPDFIRPSGADVARRIARIRSLAAQSGDRTLVRLADELERSPRRDTSPLLSHCSSEGY